MTIEPESSWRLLATIVAIVTLVSVLCAFRKIDPRQKVLKRGLAATCFVALLVAAYFIALPTQTARTDFRFETHRRLSLLRDPNVLNYHRERFDYNPDIILPSAPSGTIMRLYLPSDLHVEFDCEGRISINNARLSAKMLSAIVSARMIRDRGQVRCFLWADKRARPQQKKLILELLAHEGCAPLYCVGLRYCAGKANPDFVTTPVSAVTDACRTEKDANSDKGVFVTR